MTDRREQRARPGAGIGPIVADLGVRVRRLERRRRGDATIGPWTLTVNATGDLIATHTDGTVRVVAAAP